MKTIEECSRELSQRTEGGLLLLVAVALLSSFRTLHLVLSKEMLPLVDTFDLV